MSENSA